MSPAARLIRISSCEDAGAKGGIEALVHRLIHWLGGETWLRRGAQGRREHNGKNPKLKVGYHNGVRLRRGPPAERPKLKTLFSKSACLWLRSLEQHCRVQVRSLQGKNSEEVTVVSAASAARRGRSAIVATLVAYFTSPFFRASSYGERRR
jgi:hypothetical protein